MELQEALIEAGYAVEIIRLDEFRIAPADLELTVQKLPVVEAWRHVPNVDTVYVASGTPESCDIRSSFGGANSQQPLVVRILADIGERYEGCSRWAARQKRELSARVHEIRERWTPPREYHSTVHLEPVAPSTVEHSSESREVRIHVAIEKTRLQQEELRRRQEAEQHERQEQARIAERNRRRMREAAEAGALLREQQKIEAMVRATEKLRERVVVPNLHQPRVIERRKPRRLLLRTRRERAVFRAGIAAFTLAFALAFLTAEALHPRRASVEIPQNTSQSSAVPFARPQVPQAAAAGTQNATAKPPASVSSPAVASDLSGRRPATQEMFQEVIVRKPRPARQQTTKSATTIAHYSDLD